MPVTQGPAPSGSFNHFARIAAEVDARASKIVRVAAFHINERLQSSFRDPKYGAWYGNHRASAPGQAPAIDLGTLASSYRVVETGKYEATIGTNDEKAPWLEFGARNMAPRPHLAPAAEAESRDFKKALESLFRGLA